MKYFIGIVPPENIYQNILNIQQQFGDNKLEPHITLRPPVIVADIAAWMTAIDEVCQRFSAFTIALPTTGNFGKRVLFIDVKSEPLVQLHHSIMKAVTSFEKSGGNEIQSFNPHLTLGRSWCGFTQQDFIEMKKLANDYLTSATVSFDATFIRVYHKPGNEKRYIALKDVPLV